MKKKILTTFLFIFFLLGASICSAQGTYVRKRISPNIYVPKSAVDKPEKLPEFYYPTQDNLKEAIDDLQDKEVTHVEVKTEVVKTQTIVKKPAVSAPKTTEKPQEQLPEIVLNNKYADILLSSDTDEPPLYSQKYDEYIADISALIETGSMPQNELLEKDLAEMSSNQKKEFK